MKVIYKGKEVLLPDDNIFNQGFRWFVGLGIDFGPIFLPLVVIIAWYFLQYSPTLFYVLYIGSMIVSIFWFYLVFIKFYRFKINTFEFENSKIKAPIKFIFISDLHIENSRCSTNILRLKRIINILNSQEKDFVLIGGDILNVHYDEKLLDELKNIKGRKITILGNHDVLYLNQPKPTKQTPLKLINKLKDVGFEVLQNDGVQVANDLFIGGIKDLYTLDFDVEKAFKNSEDDQYKILLSHNPDIISFEEDLKDVDLILSGHNHAGQIDILKIHLPMPSTRQWLTKGIYEISNKTLLLLSQGAGANHLRTRLGTDFEICMIELKPSK